MALLSSCRTSKEVSTTGEPLNLKTEVAFFASFQEKVFKYNTLSARVQFELALSTGNETRSKAQLKIVKDQRLQISIQPLLGIEAIRAELTPDSFKIVNRLNRWYMIESFERIKGEIDMDFNFYNLQDLFTNRFFLPGETELTDNRFKFFKWEQTRTGYRLRTNDRAGFQYDFSTNSDVNLCVTEIKDSSTQELLNCSYSDFGRVDRQLFPMKMDFRLKTGNQAQHTLMLQFSNMEIDAPMELNFPIPGNYQRVTLQQIIHSIEQL
jgi:hypothetical protein